APADHDVIGIADGRRAIATGRRDVPVRQAGDGDGGASGDAYVQDAALTGAGRGSSGGGAVRSQRECCGKTSRQCDTTDRRQHRATRSPDKDTTLTTKPHGRPPHCSDATVWKTTRT